jgi:hypothetical protein
VARRRQVRGLWRHRAQCATIPPSDTMACDRLWRGPGIDDDLGKASARIVW